MELFVVYQLLIFGTLLLFPLLIFLFSDPKKSRHQLPPGKTGWPIIGETLEFITTGRKGYPEKFFKDRMNKYSPDVFLTSLTGQKMAVFCGASGNKFIFSNENKLVTQWWPPAIRKIVNANPVAASPEEHKLLRSKVVEFLKPEALHNYIAIMDKMTRLHFEREWKITTPDQQFKVFPLAKKLTFDLACQLLMSIEDPELVGRYSDLFMLVKAGLLSLPLNFPGTAFNRGIKAGHLIRNELLPIIRQRKSELSEKKRTAAQDLLSQILMSNGKDGYYFTEMEIAESILGLLIASHDTTSIVLASVVYFLADHPDIHAKVLKEQMDVLQSKGPEKPLKMEDTKRMKYSRNVINEVMRLVPPAIGSFKQVTNDFIYTDFMIPKGLKTFWSVHSTHKDPKYFKNPETFDPSRFEGDGSMPFTFVPFGGGPRMCPGGEFARLEILIFMHHLVLNFRWEKVFQDEKIKYSPYPAPEKGLPIRILPREVWNL